MHKPINVLSLACLSFSCASALSVSAEELAMTKHPLAADGALVLERRGTLILSYSEETNDYTGAAREFHQAMGSSGGGGASPLPPEALASVASQTLVAAGVQSYSLEVMERIKVLTDDGSLAERKIELPAESELEEVEATVYLPDGSLRKLDPAAARAEDGILHFQLPGIEAGAVACYRYKVRTKNLDSFHSWRFQGELPILDSSFWLRFKKGTEIPVHIESGDSNLRPQYHLKFAETGASKTQVKAWAIWELTNVPAARGGEPVALVVGM